MSVGFLTPLGALLGLGTLLPLAALAAAARRAGRVRAGLGLPAPPRRLALPAAAVVAVGALTGLAAAQPVLVRQEAARVRADGEAFLVVDVSRSMVAAGRPGGPTRLERAKAAALRLRASLPGVPVGIASLTDRVLPHLFPDVDEAAFGATLERAVGIERPPPRGSFLTVATKLDSLAALATRSFFSPTARRRLAIVLTDGESLPVSSATLARSLRRSPPVATVFVQLWRPGERVYARGVAEPQYRPDASARATLASLARAVGGELYGEDELSSAAAAARRLLGRGPTVARGGHRSRLPLAPYALLAEAAPVLFLLGRRDR